MCAEKTKSFLLVAGLSVAVLLGSAPAMGDGVTCRVEKSIAEVIPVDGKDRHTVPCPSGTVLTGGGVRVAKLSDELEQVVRSGSLDGSDVLATQLNRELDLVREKLEARRG